MKPEFPVKGRFLFVPSFWVDGDELSVDFLVESALLCGDFVVDEVFVATTDFVADFPRQVDAWLSMTDPEKVSKHNGQFE